MLGQRRRRWPNIKTTLIERVVFAGVLATWASLGHIPVWRDDELMADQTIGTGQSRLTMTIWRHLTPHTPPHMILWPRLCSFLTNVFDVEVALI